MRYAIYSEKMEMALRKSPAACGVASQEWDGSGMHCRRYNSRLRR